MISALIECGKRFPSVNMIERLAKVLNKDTLDLFSIKPIEITRKTALKAEIMADIEQIITNRLNEPEMP